MANHHSILYRIGQKLIFLTAPFLSNETYLKLLFFYRCHYRLDLDSPKTFNEKLQWLKLNDIHPEYERLVDKIKAKDYVSSIIGDKYIIKTLGTWDSVNEIDWDTLPNQFVIKVTSDSGGLVICKDKSKLDIKAAKAKLLKGWGKNYYNQNKEYPYRNLKPRIIAEEYMEDESGELRDYKIFCFDGEPKFLKVDFNRHTYHRANYYDTTWNLLSFYEKEFPRNPNNNLKKPENFELMLEIASKLSKNIPFVRIDLYNVKGRIYFGEITFFPASGMGGITPIEWDRKLGDLIDLSKIMSVQKEL